MSEAIKDILRQVRLLLNCPHPIGPGKLPLLGSEAGRRSIAQQSGIGRLGSDHRAVDGNRTFPLLLLCEQTGEFRGQCCVLWLVRQPGFEQRDRSCAGGIRQLCVALFGKVSRQGELPLRLVRMQCDDAGQYVPEWHDLFDHRVSRCNAVSTVQRLADVLERLVVRTIRIHGWQFLTDLTHAITHQPISRSTRQLIGPEGKHFGQSLFGLTSAIGELLIDELELETDEMSPTHRMRILLLHQLLPEIVRLLQHLHAVRIVELFRNSQLFQVRRGQPALWQCLRRILQDK